MQETAVQQLCGSIRIIILSP
uniref:Uncharacterized protein n=1 Tax=Anguilla anguilla TaxID=7936 RepID=A0A0E9XLG2_ANGAN